MRVMAVYIQIKLNSSLSAQSSLILLSPPPCSPLSCAQVSASNGAESFYQLVNNAARKEGLDLAREMDQKASQVWRWMDGREWVLKSVCIDEGDANPRSLSMQIAFIPYFYHPHFHGVGFFSTLQCSLPIPIESFKDPASNRAIVFRSRRGSRW